MRITSLAEVIAFNAGDYASPDEAFEAYRRLYSNGADVSRLKGPFNVVMRAWRFQKLIIFDRRLAGVAHARLDRVEADDFDHFTLTYVAEGRFTVTTEGRTYVLSPGEGLLLDMRRSVTNVADDVRLMTVALQRDLVEAAAGATTRLHGRLIEARDLGLLGDYLRSLVVHSDEIGEQAHGAVVRAFVELLAVTLNAAPSQGGQNRRVLATTEAAETYIGREAHRPDLTAEDVASAVNMSRASLYRLLAPVGGVGRLIALRRLHTIRRRLEAGDEASLADLARESGFRTEREARKAFRALEAVDPDAYRREMSSTPTTVVERNRRRWAAWMNNV